MTSDARRTLAASGKAQPLNLTAEQVTIAAAAGDDAGPPTFRLNAYTGGMMRIKGWPRPVVVDLAGLRFSARSRPVLRDHMADRIVGHTTRIAATADGLEVEGVVSGTGPYAREVVEAAQNGFAWRVSIGATPGRVQMVKAGQLVTVNGRTLAGPLEVVRDGVLAEVSFVSLAADDDTTANVAAKGADMDFETYVTDLGFDASKLTDAQAKALRASYAASGDADDNQGDDDGPAPAIAAQITKNRKAIAAEHARVAAINRECEGFPDIAAAAIESGWDVTRAQLEVLRAQRGTMGAPSGDRRRRDADNGAGINQATLEAGLLLSLNYPEDRLLREYGEETVNRAEPLRAMGLQDLARLSAKIDGQDIPAVWGDGKETIRAAVSTHTLGSVADNTLGKLALVIYDGGERPAEQVSRISNVRDFKQVARYRLGGTGKFAKVPAGGKVESGVLDDTKFTNQADTYGQIIRIDRRDFINDDAGVIASAATEMGFAALEALNSETFELMLSNPNSFFGSGNGNLLSGADTVLSDEALRKAHANFRNRTTNPTGKKGDKRRLSIRPEILLVPPSLEHTAMELMRSSTITTASGTDATIRRGDTNTHQGRYRVVVAPHLEDADITGNSATAWYLLANPAMVAGLEIVFLNGRRRPTFERSTLMPDSLGLAYMAYFDFGVALQDPLGVLKVAGA